jgi:F0F1-type ATP synthase assembly protein I
MSDAPNPLQPSPPGPKPAGMGRELAKAESMIQLALAVPAGCFVGLFFGYLLDRHFHTKWMVVLGMLLGAAAGFVQIFTTILRPPRGGA